VPAPFRASCSDVLQSTGEVSTVHESSGESVVQRRLQVVRAEHRRYIDESPRDRGDWDSCDHSPIAPVETNGAVHRRAGDRQASGVGNGEFDELARDGQIPDASGASMRGHRAATGGKTRPQETLMPGGRASQQSVHADVNRLPPTYLQEVIDSMGRQAAHQRLVPGHQAVLGGEEPGDPLMRVHEPDGTTGCRHRRRWPDV
jgi:hypothetical protein